MELSTNYKLRKLEDTDVVNIEDFNDNTEKLDSKIKEIETEVSVTKKSVSDGKSEIAAAITQKKVPTAADATFSQMATNINRIIVGSGNATAADVLAPKTFTNGSGIEQSGTIPSKGAATITPGKTNQMIAAGQYLSGTQTIASLGGNATAAQVLSGYTFSSDAAGRAVGGGMVNRGAPTYILGINGTQNLEEGYYSGGSIRQSIATFGGQTITPSRAQQTAATAGKYCTGNVVVAAIPTQYVDTSVNQSVFGNGVFGSVVNRGISTAACGTVVNSSYEYYGIYKSKSGTTIGIIGTPTIVGSELQFSCASNREYSGFVPSGTIDLTPYSTISATIRFSSVPSSAPRLRIYVFDPVRAVIWADHWTDHRKLVAREVICRTAGVHNLRVDISGVNQHAFVLVQMSYSGSASATGYVTEITLLK